MVFKSKTRSADLTPPSAKRQRVSESPPDLDDVSVNHRRFMDWVQTRGVEIDGVAPRKLPGKGLGLVTTKAMQTGERMLFIPVKAMFKPDVAFLKQHALQKVSPQAQLAISVMASCREAKAVSKKTDFTKEDMEIWTATWPTKTNIKRSIPLGWQPGYAKSLPHSARGPYARQYADWIKDWHAVETLCKEKRWSEESFKYYWLIVNSRSFHWKAPNGSGSMVLCPFIDYMNHGPTGDTTAKVLFTDEGYSVVAQRDYEAGEEVLATYGGHSNDKLLVHYGFMLSPDSSGPSPDDEIRLDDILLAHLDENTQVQLQDMGYLGGYSLIPSTNEICFKTQVAVRAQLLTSNEWEYFVSSGEDLGEDKSDEVAAWLKPHFEEYRKTAEYERNLMRKMYDTYTGHEGGEGNPVRAISLLVERWSQIIDALTAFIKS